MALSDMLKFTPLEFETQLKDGPTVSYNEVKIYSVGV